MACPTVTNDRGRSSDGPCAVFCGPLDVASWQRAASRELEAARVMRPHMTAPELRELDRLEVADASPPEWSVMSSFATDAVNHYASLAQKARCLWFQVGERSSSPAPTAPSSSPPTAPPGPSSPWSWPTIPGLPGFPSLDLGGVLPVLLVLGLVLLAFSPPARAASRASRRAER